MALAGQTLVALIVDGVAGVAHQRHHAPQENVHLAVVGEAFQHPGADEPVVGVVEYDVCAQRVHHMVEALGGEPLEEGVGVPAAAHAVDYLGAVQILFDHLVHGVDVVLTVAVDGDGDVAAAAVERLHQPGQHGVLVAAVPALGDADEVIILRGELLDEGPGGVAGAVVDEEHPALLADKARCGEVVYLFQEQGGCDGEYLFFIVAGNDDP